MEYNFSQKDKSYSLKYTPPNKRKIATIKRENVKIHNNGSQFGQQNEDELQISILDHYASAAQQDLMGYYSIYYQHLSKILKQSINKNQNSGIKYKNIGKIDRFANQLKADPQLEAKVAKIIEQQYNEYKTLGSSQQVENENINRISKQHQQAQKIRQQLLNQYKSQKRQKIQIQDNIEEQQMANIVKVYESILGKHLQYPLKQSNLLNKQKTNSQNRNLQQQEQNDKNNYEPQNNNMSFNTQFHQLPQISRNSLKNTQSQQIVPIRKDNNQTNLKKTIFPKKNGNIKDNKSEICFNLYQPATISETVIFDDNNSEYNTSPQQINRNQLTVQPTNRQRHPTFGSGSCNENNQENKVQASQMNSSLSSQLHSEEPEEKQETVKAANNFTSVHKLVGKRNQISSQAKKSILSNYIDVRNSIPEMREEQNSIEDIDEGLCLRMHSSIGVQRQSQIKNEDYDSFLKKTQKTLKQQKSMSQILAVQADKVLKQDLNSCSQYMDQSLMLDQPLRSSRAQAEANEVRMTILINHQFKSLLREIFELNYIVETLKFHLYFKAYETLSKSVAEFNKQIKSQKPITIQSSLQINKMAQIIHVILPSLPRIAIQIIINYIKEQITQKQTQTLILSYQQYMSLLNPEITENQFRAYSTQTFEQGKTMQYYKKLLHSIIEIKIIQTKIKSSVDENQIWRQIAVEFIEENNPPPNPINPMAIANNIFNSSANTSRKLSAPRNAQPHTQFNRDLFKVELFCRKYFPKLEVSEICNWLHLTMINENIM